MKAMPAFFCPVLPLHQMTLESFGLLQHLCEVRGSKRCGARRHTLLKRLRIAGDEGLSERLRGAVWVLVRATQRFRNNAVDEPEFQEVFRREP